MMTIDKTRCVNCGSCIPVCPMHIFIKDEAGQVSAREKPCLDCYHCAALCPTQAIGCDKLTDPAFSPASDLGSPLRNLVRNRRSIRRFTAQAPDRALVQQVLDDAAFAPSAKNQHPNRWIAVLGRERVDQVLQTILDWAAGEKEYRALVWAANKGYDPVTCGASCLILTYAPDDAVYPTTDSVIAAACVDLLLSDAGLGACWGGYLCRAANLCPSLRELLSIPEGHSVQAALMVGYPDERYPRRPYRPSASVQWLE